MLYQELKTLTVSAIRDIFFSASMRKYIMGDIAELKMNLTVTEWIILIVLVVAIGFAIMALNIARSKYIIGAADAVNNDLSKEYEAWSITKQRRDIITAGLDRKKSYEALNILERWILSGANFGAEDRDSPVTRKMKSELAEKRIVTGAAADELLDKLASVKPLIAPAENPAIVDGKVIYGDFVHVLSRDRLKILRAKAADIDIIRAVLRYASMSLGSQQWNIPFGVYKVLVEKYRADVEAFASPFNSQIIRFPRGGFCSLFPDTDKVFGSVGNFFDYNLAGHVAVVNPPYILDMLTAATDKCIADISGAENSNRGTRFFITVPDWTDADYYSKLSGSKYLETAIHLKSGEYYYEDSNNLDVRIPARFNTTLFILSWGLPAEKYSDVIRAFTYGR